MKRYKNLTGESGVRYYDIAEKEILVVFSDGQAYLYSYDKTGKREVEQMKRLARRGEGLNAYINTNVKNKYEWKVPKAIKHGTLIHSMMQLEQ